MDTAQSRSVVEIKAKPEIRGKRQFSELLEYILRYELAIVLDANKQWQAFYHEAGFFLQNQDFIATEISTKLATDHKLYVDCEQVKDYLKDIVAVIRNMLALGHDYEALPFTSKSYQRQLAGGMKAPRKQKGRPKKHKSKREHKRRYAHPNGQVYDSIKEAAEANNEDYNALRAKALYDMKKVLNAI